MEPQLGLQRGDPARVRDAADRLDALIANSGQPGRLVADGPGYRLSGRWKIVSGIESADWVALLSIVFDGDQPRMTAAGPDVRICRVPRDAVTVLDTWQVTGMRGTNSNTVVAEDVSVPADLVVPFSGDAADRSAGLPRTPDRSGLSGLCGGAAGMAQAAVDEVAALAARKVGIDGVPLAGQPRLQAAVGPRPRRSARRGCCCSTPRANSIARRSPAGRPPTHRAGCCAARSATRRRSPGKRCTRCTRPAAPTRSMSRAGSVGSSRTVRPRRSTPTCRRHTTRVGGRHPARAAAERALRLRWTSCARGGGRTRTPFGSRF